METVNTENRRLSGNITNGINNVVENIRALNAYTINAAAINKLESYRDPILAKWPDLDANVPGRIKTPVMELIKATKQGKAKGSSDMIEINKQWAAILTILGDYIGVAPTADEKKVLSGGSKLEAASQLVDRAKRRVLPTQPLSIPQGIASTVVLGSVADSVVTSPDDEMARLREKVVNNTPKRADSYRKKLIKTPSIGRNSSNASNASNASNEASPSSLLTGGIRGLLMGARPRRSTTMVSTASTATNAPETNSYPGIPEMPETFVAELEDTSISARRPTQVHNTAVSQRRPSSRASLRRGGGSAAGAGGEAVPPRSSFDSQMLSNLRWSPYGDAPPAAHETQLAGKKPPSRKSTSTTSSHRSTRPQARDGQTSERKKKKKKPKKPEGEEDKL